MANYNWNWSLLVREPYLGWLFSGVTWTILLALGAWLIAVAVGSAVGVARTLPFAPARGVGAAYVEIFRNIPLLAQMFLWFFVLPELLPRDWGRWIKRDLPNPEFVSAVLCLGFYTASRVAEQVRSGIGSLPPSALRSASSVARRNSVSMNVAAYDRSCMASSSCHLHAILTHGRPLHS